MWITVAVKQHFFPQIAAKFILWRDLNLFNHPMDALKSLNDSLSATFQACSWIIGPEMGIFLERAVLKHAFTEASSSSLFKRVHGRFRLDAVLSSNAVIYSALCLIVQLTIADFCLFYFLHIC